MFPINTRAGENQVSLNRDEIQDVRMAMAEAVDATLLLYANEEQIKVVEFLLRMAGDQKLIYMLGAQNIRELLERYIANEPYRGIVEDLTSRFIGFLPSSEQLYPKLTVSLTRACCSMNTSTVLPKDLVQHTVSPNDVQSLLQDEPWITTIVTIALYYNNSLLTDSFKRVGIAKEKGRRGE